MDPCSSIGDNIYIYRERDTPRRSIGIFIDPYASNEVNMYICIYRERDKDS